MDLTKLLQFPLEGLRADEEINVDNWLKNLRGADIENVNEFLSRTLRFYKKLVIRNPRTFYIMNAIGSTTIGKPDYGDIDFLLLTNGEMPSMMGSFLPDLQKELLPIYHFDNACTFDTDNYFENPASLPGRDTAAIYPAEGMKSPWKKIHLTFQRNVPSELIWAERDIEPRVPLYRLIKPN